MRVFPAVCLRRRGSCPGRQLGCAGHAQSDVLRPLATQLSPAPITKGKSALPELKVMGRTLQLFQRRLSGSQWRGQPLALGLAGGNVCQGRRRQMKEGEGRPHRESADHTEQREATEAPRYKGTDGHFHCSIAMMLELPCGVGGRQTWITWVMV